MTLHRQPIAEQPALRTEGGRVVVVLEAGKAGEHYLRLRTERPARLVTLEKEPSQRGTGRQNPFPRTNGGINISRHMP
jgi:hypothetical protein